MMVVLSCVAGMEASGGRCVGEWVVLSAVAGIEASGGLCDGCVVLCVRNGSNWWLVSGLCCPL